MLGLYFSVFLFDFFLLYRVILLEAYKINFLFIHFCKELCMDISNCEEYLSAFFVGNNKISFLKENVRINKNHNIFLKRCFKAFLFFKYSRIPPNI